MPKALRAARSRGKSVRPPRSPLRHALRPASPAHRVKFRSGTPYVIFSFYFQYPTARLILQPTKEAATISTATRSLDEASYSNTGCPRFTAVQSGNQGGRHGLCVGHGWHRSEDESVGGIDDPGANAASNHPLSEHF